MEYLAVSPTSILHHQREIDLDTFLSRLPKALQATKTPLHDQVMELFSQLSFDYSKYALSDCSRNYTRNLVASDGETYALMILCWSPSKCSPIHDHPSKGCWMQVLRGSISETRYRKAGDYLEPMSTHEATEGECIFIEDSLGYHKVGNPNQDEAITLHLYSPPFKQSKVWFDPKLPSTKATMTYYSVDGNII